MRNFVNTYRRWTRYLLIFNHPREDYTKSLMEAAFDLDGVAGKIAVGRDVDLDGDVVQAVRDSYAFLAGAHA